MWYIYISVILRRGEQASISELHVDEDSYRSVHTIISINISCALLPKVHFDRHQPIVYVTSEGLLLRRPACAVKLLARDVLISIHQTCALLHVLFGELVTPDSQGHCVW